MHRFHVGADDFVLFRELGELSSAKEELRVGGSVQGDGRRGMGRTLYLSLAVELARNWRDWSCVRTVMGFSTWML